MKKLLSVLLSFSILVSSVSPSCAQLIRFLSTSTKTSEEATALAARNAARMMRVAANHEIALIPWKYINIYQVPEGYQFAFGGKKLADVLPTLVQTQGVKDVSANVLPSVNASMQPELGRRLEGAIQEQLVSQINSRQELLSKFDSQTLSNFSPDQIQELFDWVFSEQVIPEVQNKFFFNIVPQYIVSRSVEVSIPRRMQLIRSYRDTLNKISYTGRPIRFSIHNVDLKTWAEAMAAVSNLGLFGNKADAQLILDVAKKAPEKLRAYTDVIAGRALLALGEDAAVKELAVFSLGTQTESHSPFWAGVSALFEENNLSLGIPISSVTGHTPVPAVEQSLVDVSELNTLNLDMSREATADWIAQRILTKPYMPGSSVAREEVPVAEQPLSLQPSLQISLEGDRQVHPINLPNLESLEPGVTSPAPAAVTAKTPVVSTTPSRAAEQPSLLRQYLSKVLPTFLNRDARAANRSAAMALNKPRPMITQLRDILFSEASVSFKKQALMRLYEDHVLDEAIAGLPSTVRAPIERATTREALELAIWKLYDAHFFDTTLEEIADVAEQGSLLQELQGIVSQADWKAKAARAYEEEDVLPFTGEDNFSGVVPTVPVADQKSILATFRPNGFAVENKMKHIDTAAGSYYKNNIPFYYRNSKGELSSWPVGILSQEPADWYGRLLSHLHLANQPGMTIPKGFVLALDEQGQWKLVMPKGNLAIVESNPASRKILERIQKDGSVRVPVDSPYSTTDLLAMAHMLEHNPTLNLELTLNTSHSLKQFLFAHALFVGNDAGNSLTGPFKDSLKAVKGFASTLANAVSGVGYMTPIAGGYAMPFMSKLGNVRTTQLIYAMSGSALLFSLLKLGMYGTVDPATLPLASLAIPTVALVLGASLANSFIPTFLNFYKDPTARTAANLDFATNKQMSRLGLTGATALLAWAWGLNWTVVVPAGLGLLAGSYALFINTPMFREAKAMRAAAAAKKAQEAAAFAALSPEQQAAQQEARAQEASRLAEENAQFLSEYREFRDNLPEMRDIRSRVKMVYASYAASLMMLGQSATQVLGPGVGQGFITACMLATYFTRKMSTVLVKKNRVTDDQLTGISLPLLATTGAALALAPYSGPLAVLTGLAGVLHYMATAVPGQLDAARMQNIVTAEMRARKLKIEENTALTQEQKDAEIQRLRAEEQVWSAQASKDYSLYNSRGLWGIGAATAGAFLFADYGPQWTKDVLEWVSNTLDAPTPTLALNRLLFGYSTSVAGILAWKNRGLAMDFFNLFGSHKVTEDLIAANKITPKTFGINEKNASLRLVDTQKQIKELSTQLVDYGRTSEQKMTTMLNKLVSAYNRLVAQSTVLGMDAVNPAFDELRQVLHSYEAILTNQHNDLSIMLQRQFATLKGHLYEAGGAPVVAPTYMEEGTYQLPKEYDAYESARWLVSELDQLAYSLRQHGSRIDANDFVSYLNRARENLLRYEKANPADAARIAKLRRHMDSICQALQKDADHLLKPTGTETPEELRDLQKLRDVLAAYAE